MSSHSKVKTAELFDTTESAYEVAAWFGMLDIMNTIGSLDSSQLSGIRGIGRHALRVCKNVAHKPEHLLNNLYTWRLNPRRRKALGFIGIYNDDGDLSQSVEAAADIYVDYEWQTELLKNTEFGELLTSAKDLAIYYAPQALTSIANKSAFDEKFLNIYRDINFYVGSYDPES